MKHLFDFDELEIVKMCSRESIKYNDEIVDDMVYIKLKNEITTIIESLDEKGSATFWNLVKEYYEFQCEKIKAFNEPSKHVELGENKIFLSNSTIYEQEEIMYNYKAKNCKKFENKDLDIFPFLKRIYTDFYIIFSNYEIELYLDRKSDSYIPQIMMFNSQKKAVLIISRNTLILGKENPKDFFTIINHELGHLIQNDIHPARDEFWKNVIRKKFGWAILIFCFFIYGILFLIRELTWAFEYNDKWEIFRPNNWIGILKFIGFVFVAAKFIVYPLLQLRKDKRIISEFLSDIYATLKDRSLNMISVLESAKYISIEGSSSHPEKQLRIEKLKATLVNMFIISLSHAKLKVP